MNKEKFIKYREARDAGRTKEATRLRDELVMENMPLVKRFIARENRRSSIPISPEDLSQAGAIGLMRAIEKYDPERAAFSTYAAHWIRHEMQAAQKAETRVHRPAHSGMPYSAWKKSQAFEAQHGRKPTAEELGVTEEQYRDYETNDVSFLLLDACEDGTKEIEDTSAGAEKLLMTEEVRKTLERHLEGLKPRERRILRGIFFEDRRVEDVARDLDLSVSYVQILRDQAMVKLRARIK